MFFSVRKILILALFCAFFAVPSLPVQANNFRSTDLPLPRYVSLRSDKVYARTGPALRYPIKWVYKRDDLPVEVTQEFENWRKVRGIEGEEGWIHQSLLSNARSVIVQSADLVSMREGFSYDAKMIARLEPRVIARLERCSDNWCRIETGGYRGWVQRKFLWGIYAHEELN